MARTVITLTDAWQQVAAGACVLRVASTGGRARAKISLNQTASDVAATEDLTSPGAQYLQNEAKPVFAKGADVIVIVDTAG